MAPPTTKADFYTLSFLQFTHCLESLLSILKKASDSPEADTFPSLRLHEDMNDLTFQVSVVNTVIGKAVLRILGKEIETWADEKTLPEFIARTQKTLDQIKGVTAEEVNSKENESTTLELGTYKFKLPALGYVQAYPIPTLYFHVTTVYAILRMKGVPLGKADYVTPFVNPYMECAV